MEDYKEGNNNKRARDEPEDSVEVNSPESKLARFDSVNSDDEKSPESNVNASKDSDDSGVSSTVAMRIQDDLLDIFDDSDPDPAIQGLDSVIRSFEEEILVPDPATVTTSDACGSRPELGYLLEASDDELGLPPSFSSGGAEQKIETIDSVMYGSGSVSLDDIGLGFDEGMPNFEPYKLAIGGESDNTFSTDLMTLGGGLFESYEAGEISELLWRPESLPAL